MDTKKDKILITQLGKTKYKTTIYVDENGRFLSETGYAFDAIVKKERPNKLLLLGTAESFWSEIIEWYSMKKSLTKIQEKEKIRILEILEKKSTEKQIKQEEKNINAKEQTLNSKNKIWSEIANFIRQIAEFEYVNIVIIPRGQNDEELVQYFDILRIAMQDTIDAKKETEIIFDISNGFRSMPLYIMMLVKFITLVNKNSIHYLAYYGMFEAKNAQNETPLVNLTKVTEMTEWINAISEFRNFGSVKALYQCLKSERKNAKLEEDKKKIEEIIQRFEIFEYAMNANNLYYLKESVNYIMNMDLEKFPLPNQAKILLVSLKEDFRERFIERNSDIAKKYESTYLLVKLSEMYVEQGRYSAASIAIQEGTITYIMEKYLKERLKKEVELGTEEEFKKYIQIYKNRDRVKRYLDEEFKNYAKGTIKEKYPFGANYLAIKRTIRNVSAHIIPIEDIPRFEEMEEWIYIAINSILEDMCPGHRQNHKTKIVDLEFERVYKDFSFEDENKKEKDELSNFFALDEKYGWKLLKLPVSEIEKEYRDFISKQKLDIRKIKELRTILLKVRQKCEREEPISMYFVKNHSILFGILKLWEKKNCQQASYRAKSEEQLNQLLKADKNKNKNAFEKLQNMICINMRKEVLELLK